MSQLCVKVVFRKEGKVVTPSVLVTGHSLNPEQFLEQNHTIVSVRSLVRIFKTQFSLVHISVEY